MLRSRTVLLSTAALVSVTLCGCEGGRRPGAVRRPPPPGVDDQAREVVIGRINDNAERLNFLLRGRVTAKGRWDGETFDLNGTLLYRRPRILYLKLEHTLSKGIEIGSNEEEFWVWKRLGEDRYWWGRHEFMDAASEAELPIRPDHILQVMGLQPLEDRPGAAPLFWVSPTRYELIYTSTDADGRTFITRTMNIDRRSPHMVREILFFHPDGHPVVSAQLSDYRAVEGTPVVAPYRMEMRWLEEDSWLDLQVRRFENAGTGSTARRAETRFTSPLSQGRNVGPVERVDRPPTSSGNRPTDRQ